MSARTWHIVTGEYPPDRGGVGDHTAVLASALADRSHEVHVWTGGSGPAAHGRAHDDPSGVSSPDASVKIHRVAGAFDGAGLARLSAALDGFAARRTVLIQYAPRAFGRWGMNVGFCRWVRRRGRLGDDVRVMFHEPFFPFGTGSVRRDALAVVNRWMARTLLAAASRAYVSIPAWEPMLCPWAPRGLGPMPWLPVGSTVPHAVDPSEVEVIRERVRADLGAGLVIGHFGTYGSAIAPMLEAALRLVLAAEPTTVALLLGDGGPAFADRLAGADAMLRRRLVAPGYLPAEAVSLHLQACDVAVQPYPDGASSRRTTLMAALANAVPTVTTDGELTEDVWRTGPVPLAPAGDAERLAREVVDLLRDPSRRVGEGRAGREFYERHFSIDRAVAVLEDG